MSVEINQSVQESGLCPPQTVHKQGTVNRCTPKKSLESKLWDLLQPIARLWGLITAIGRYYINLNF